MCYSQIFTVNRCGFFLYKYTAFTNQKNGQLIDANGINGRPIKYALLARILYMHLIAILTHTHTHIHRWCEMGPPFHAHAHKHTLSIIQSLGGRRALHPRSSPPPVQMLMNLHAPLSTAINVAVGVGVGVVFARVCACVIKLNIFANV